MNVSVLFMRLESMFFQMKKLPPCRTNTIPSSSSLMPSSTYWIFCTATKFARKVIKELQGYKRVLTANISPCHWTLDERVATLESIDMSLQEAYALNFKSYQCLARERTPSPACASATSTKAATVSLKSPPTNTGYCKTKTTKSPSCSVLRNVPADCARVALVLQLVRAGAETPTNTPTTASS